MDSSNTGGSAPQATRGVTFFSRVGNWIFIPSRHFNRDIFHHDDPDRPELFAYDYGPGSVLIHIHRTHFCATETFTYTRVLPVYVRTNRNLHIHTRSSRVCPFLHTHAYKPVYAVAQPQPDRTPGAGRLNTSCDRSPISHRTPRRTTVVGRKMGMPCDLKL